MPLLPYHPGYTRYIPPCTTVPVHTDLGIPGAGEEALGSEKERITENVDVSDINSQ